MKMIATVVCFSLLILAFLYAILSNYIDVRRSNKTDKRDQGFSSDDGGDFHKRVLYELPPDLEEGVAPGKSLDKPKSYHILY